MADDFKDISHLYKVTPSAKTIIDGEDLVETKQKLPAVISALKNVIRRKCRTALHRR